VPAVRLFIGNLPYNATEEDIRTHFATVAPPTQIVRPLDRETGRARGFAFVEYGERTHAEEAIKRFDGQLFMGRPLAVSEARARDDRGPSGPPRPGGGYAPRPGGMGAGPGAPRPGGYSPRPAGEGGGYAGRPGGYRSNPGDPPLTEAAMARQRNFGPPAPPKGKKGPKPGFAQKERGPKGPIPTKFTARVYGLDDEAEAASAAADDALPDFMKAEPAEPVEPAEAGDAVETPDTDDKD
jgi:RNA recognition motif-containing protein